MNRKILYSILLIFLCFTASLFFLEEGKSYKSNSSENVRLSNGLSRNTVIRKEDSLFESGDFLNFTESEDLAVTDISSITTPKNEYSTLSPEEKDRIRKEVIQRVKSFADRFPDNLLIPRELTKAQEDKRKKDEERMSEVRIALLEGREVVKPEMEFYLDSKIKKTEDMVEILEYSMKFFQDSRKNNQGSSLKLIEERLVSLQKSKEELTFAKKNLNVP
ncbi:hypothetical protein LEP1GSC132_0100 [Leptospira kirschneri str. 200803703]|uniref:Uncharacterized protein n=1 Tax=Leptospira kirschneri str. 200802841 TaxID=1193047 RepID=A0A828Y6Z2_9LEPT|nr:hypothetical protein [Leptospira kirschneri]EMO75008.1 hypothetical protein LEP1GSC127_0483 [Leptospira kirschneri str. 200801925]EJO67972.1 hypothetical protein LEP1GSC044_0572 [Leptospira kirschneri serovar Grippotyphosa str. RM52]EKO53819.1 hypothetical protein LEP1GSC131_3049 [Leptospira kirschneri str. 200802841]EKP06920.1 hypothetical protein LEP1GSC018_1208 [Leptospira kirschneri str. 2008720114]EMK06364.1 hypothetical protein LEP1GSC176_3698 [Leptospira kirschneri str. MMD1493]